MKRHLIFLPLIFLTGCASVLDAPRNILGFSRRDMDEARVNSLYQTYQEDYADIFQAVILLSEENKYHIFLKDEVRGLIVLMDIPGVVDTTEVGVFLTAFPRQSGVKVEISSRSAPAKRIVAQTLFSQLSAKFKKI